MNALLTLVAADIGNVNTKYRRHGGSWAVEPSLVRMVSDRVGYSFTNAVPVKPFVYLSGPAAIEPNVPYLVGEDAARAGISDVAIIGSAEVRAHSHAYLLLHLYAIAASLPPRVTTAHIAFAGGLPVEDDSTSHVKETLRARLTGRAEKGTPPVPHVFRWGDEEFTLTVSRVSFIPQPIGAVATLLFTPDGRIQPTSTMLRQRYALDIGGGTTDYTGRRGLELIPGPEGGIRIGVQNTAETARALIQRRFPSLRHLDAGQVLALIRSAEPTLYVAGEGCDVSAEIQAAITDTANAIVAHVLPRWERTLAQGEVLLFGGGGSLMAESISAVLAPIAPVSLMPEPITRVADGIERLAKYRLQAE